MAKCEKRQIVPEPPPAEYVLTLSEDEAQVLLAITSSVDTPSGQGGDIWEALTIAGATGGKYYTRDQVSVRRRRA